MDDTAELAGTTALVTGGGSGIGLACARHLLRDGARVVLLGRTEQRLADAAVALRAGTDASTVDWVVADVTDEAAVAEAVARANTDLPLRTVVASAGISAAGPVAQTPLDAWRTVLDINLTGVFVTLKQAAPVLRANGGGSFTAISSTGAVTATSYLSAYCAAKAGVDMLVRTAADEMGQWGIRVNCVRAGVVATEINAGLGHDLMRANLDNVPLGRLGQPDEVAAMVAYLSGPRSGWITGAAMSVDGGHQLRRGLRLEPVIRGLYGPEWVPDDAPES